MDPYVALRRKLHCIPELGFEEQQTQDALCAFVEGLPQEHLSIHRWRTGLLIEVRGKGGPYRLGFRADMDGLPLQEQTGLPYASQHAGRMHACGHDFHMAIACGVLAELASSPLSNDALFLFQPAEEGPGGALAMQTTPLYQSLAPDAIFALHIAPQYPVGTIATRPGALFAQTQEFMISLQGKSSHAAEPHRGKDMVVAVSALVLQLSTILSRNVDPKQVATLCIGELQAGTKQNIVADQATLRGTIRSLTPPTQEVIQQRIQECVAGVESSFSCEARLAWGAAYAAVKNDPAWYLAFQSYLQTQPHITSISCNPTLAGEDFGFFLRATPGLLFWLGVDSPYPLHHPELAPREEAIPLGITTVTGFLRWIDAHPEQSPLAGIQGRKGTRIARAPADT